MSDMFRRYEFLLPLRFNDGEPVSESLIADTLAELEQRFGAVSWETQVIRGQWQHQSLSYRDDLVRIFVDVSDSEETREFFVAYKNQLKERFRQIEIWMTTYPIDVI